MNCGDMLTTTIENEPQRGQGGGSSALGSAGVAAGFCFFFWPRRGLAGRRLTIERRIYHDVS
jgi:hypothetical protein